VKRVLFIGEAVTLAHVARCVTLSRALDSGGYTCTSPGIRGTTAS